MKRGAPVIKAGVAAAALLAAAWWFLPASEDDDDARYMRGETEVEFANPAGAGLSLFRAGDMAGEMRSMDLPQVGGGTGQRIWLGPGRYALRADMGGATFWFSIPLTGYRSGPDEDGLFRLTIRKAPDETGLPTGSPASPYVPIPAGTFLLGDPKNPGEAHHVWLPAFLVAVFEVTNGEFREFLADPEGYGSRRHWTAAGWEWHASEATTVTAALKRDSRDYGRFGLPDQPVVWVSWFEADAYCAWLTARKGGGRWLFTLPTEAEWEKVARGPESFDYAQGMRMSDAEAGLYNWRRNPSSDTTLVGVTASRLRYLPNRFGAYHLTGNALEWTRSLSIPYSRKKPYEDDARNAAAGSGRRVARGGSWYSASNAYLLNSYRDAFQPEHSSQELGFRAVAKRLP